MAKVGIVMGSDSDMAVMSKAAAVLEEFGIDYEMRIISAHREPEELVSWAKGAEERGIRVIIAGAGMAAALPGMVAALFPLPVIGVPMSSKELLQKIRDYGEEGRKNVVAKDARLQETGYRNYTK